MKVGIMQFNKKALLASVILAISGAALAATSTPTDTVKGHIPAYADIGIQFHDADGNGLVNADDTISIDKGAFQDVDGDTEGTATYQWYRDGAAIPGETGDSYTLTAADIGHSIKVGVTAHTDPTNTDPADGNEQLSSRGGNIDGSGDGSVTTDGNDVLSVAITGMTNGYPLVGEQLTAVATCTTGATCTGTVNYQWKIESAIGSGVYVDIGGATSSTYTPVGTDQKRKIQVDATRG